MRAISTLATLAGGHVVRAVTASGQRDEASFEVTGGIDNRAQRP